MRPNGPGLAGGERLYRTDGGPFRNLVAPGKKKHVHFRKSRIQKSEIRFGTFVCVTKHSCERKSCIHKFSESRGSHDLYLMSRSDSTARIRNAEEFSIAFATAVTEATNNSQDWIAKKGADSIFAVLNEIFPQVIRTIFANWLSRLSDDAKTI